MEPASNKSAFKLKSGNKPSTASLSGVSPVKNDPEPRLYTKPVEKIPSLGLESLRVPGTQSFFEPKGKTYQEEKELFNRLTSGVTAVHGMQQRTRDMYRQMAIDTPGKFFKIFGQEPDEYIKNIRQVYPGDTKSRFVY
tara:strand:+ start:1678 stop:2091 length:414 start_codon:yes stop_codon:yes gene_type:complete